MTKAARGVLLAIFAVCVYRSAVVSVTPPEAAIFNRFVGPSLEESFAMTAVNSHVLYTLLARISTSIFHLTDLSLRLPSLLGAALYFWAAYRLAWRLGGGPRFLAVLALLSLNPLVLDYFSMAQGYGLAVAFWIWALELMLEEKLNLAGVCLGLSVAANLVFLPPAIGLAAVFSFRGRVRQSGRRFQDLWLPAFLTAFLIMVIPLNHADLRSFRPEAIGPGRLLGALPEYTDARSVMKAIRQDAGGRAVRVGASSGLDQVLNYYRTRYALLKWAPVEAELRTSSFDYYALNQEDARLILERHLHVIWRNDNFTVAR